MGSRRSRSSPPSVLHEASRVLNYFDGRQALLDTVSSTFKNGEQRTLSARDRHVSGLDVRIYREDATTVADYVVAPEANLEGLRHPLTAVFPTLGDYNGAIATEPWPDARFEFLAQELVGPIKRGEIGTTAKNLLDYLGRVVAREPNRDPLGTRFVEPGVGRSCIVDFLRIKGRPEIVDFSVLGIGSTRYCDGGFYLRGIHIDGFNSLKRAQHRRESALRLASEGIRVPYPVAVVSLPGIRNIMPDGRLTAAALLVRGFRSVLRIHQLDPLCGFLNSDQHRDLVRDFLKDVGNGSDRDREVAALEPCLCRCPSFIVSPTSAELCGNDRDGKVSRETRLRITLSYAPMPLGIAKARVARELGRHPEAEPMSNSEYTSWFAERMGEQLARMKELRFLNEYRLARSWRDLRHHSLVETNVSLLAEFADLDTSIFVDSPDSFTLDALGIAGELVHTLQRNYEEYHAIDVQRMVGIVRTLAYIASEGDADAAREATVHFQKTYESLAGKPVKTTLIGGGGESCTKL